MNRVSMCATCGYEWTTGRDGSHRCAETLLGRLAQARAERDMAVALLVAIEANMRRAWNDRSLSANAWPADLAAKLTEAVVDLTGAPSPGRSPGF